MAEKVGCLVSELPPLLCSSKAPSAEGGVATCSCSFSQPPPPPLPFLPLLLRCVVTAQHKSEIQNLMRELQARDSELNDMSANHTKQLEAWVGAAFTLVFGVLACGRAWEWVFPPPSPFLPSVFLRPQRTHFVSCFGRSLSFLLSFSFSLPHTLFVFAVPSFVFAAG